MSKKILLAALFIFLVVTILLLFHPREFRRMLPSEFNITHYDEFTVEKFMGNKSYTKEFSTDEMIMTINYFNSLKYMSYYHLKKDEKVVESYFIRLRSSKSDEKVDIRTIGKKNIAIMYNDRRTKIYKVLKSDIDLDFLNSIFDEAEKNKN